MIGWGPNSYLLGHVTGLLFWLYLNTFLPSIFNSVDFWNSMSWIVPDIELADKNVFREMGVFIDRNVQGPSFRPPKKYKPTKQTFWCLRNLHGIVWIGGRFDYSELSNILPSALKGEYFAKGLEKCEILASFFLRKRWKISKITAVPKFNISLMKVFGFARVTHSITRPNFTVQSGVRQKCLVTE